MEEIREVPHFENGVEHKILITYVIAKVSDCFDRSANVNDENNRQRYFY